MALLELRNLTKAFGGLMAVNDVSIHVEPGEIVGLIGPNGSGKTTTFNCINQFFPVTSGDIFFKEKSVIGLKPHEICLQGIGRTFQVLKPLARMTVLDSVTASVFCRADSLKEARMEALKVLEFCNLDRQKERLAENLPIPGRKRLEIARALATKPELLLLDETAAGLNPGELDEAVELIKKIRENGISILIVEHIMKVVMSISDRIHAINFGRTIAEGTPREVANNTAVIEAYLGEPHARG